MTLFSMMLGREVQILEYLVFGLPVGDAHVPQGGGGGGGEQEYEHLKRTMQNAHKSIQDRAWKAMQHQKNVYDQRQNQHTNATRRVTMSGSTVLLSQVPSPMAGAYKVEKQVWIM